MSEAAVIRPLSSGWRLFGRLDAAVAALTERSDRYLDRRGVAVLLIVLLWACAVLPNFGVRAFIFEEGTNAEIARDVLAHGHFLEPYIYGLRWHEKPSLLGWLIAAVATVTGGVNEWSARLPVMIAVLATALLVQQTTRRYAGPTASLFAGLAFAFCPLLLQKLTVAEPDTVITALSFAAFVLWWDGAAGGRVSLLRWIGCGGLLAVLAMAKGPQPAGFFFLGVGAYIFGERRWRDVPGLVLCGAIPTVALIAWAAAIYRPGDEGTWLGYARLGPPSAGLSGYLAENSYSLVSLALELLPSTIMLPFVPWPWRRGNTATNVPAIVKPALLYAGVCMLALVFWPGFKSRYAMPIAPAVAVLAGIAWDRLGKSDYALVRRIAATIVCIFIVFQIVWVVAITPLFADRFAANRDTAEAVEQAVRAAPAPAFCSGFDTNTLFYVRVPVHCLDLQSMASQTPPFWLLGPRDKAAAFARLRPDLDARIVLDQMPNGVMTAVRVERR